jgi:hypothetical protein
MTVGDSNDYPLHINRSLKSSVLVKLCKVMSKESKVIESVSEKTDKYDYYWIIKHQYQKLRGRLMNLAETLKEDQEARKALKGIFHDYLDQAHYSTQSEIERHLIETKFIDGQDKTPIAVLKGFEEEIN